MQVSGELGRLIHGVMLVRGMSVEDLHQRSGLSGQTIYNILKGLRTMPTRRTLEKLSEALGVPLEHLWQAALHDHRPEDAGPVVQYEEGVWLSWTRGLAHLMADMPADEQERLRRSIAEFVQLQLLMQRRTDPEGDDGAETAPEPEIAAGNRRGGN